MHTRLTQTARTASWVTALALTVPIVGCTDSSSPQEAQPDPSADESSAAIDPSPDSSGDIDGLVDIGDGRKLYVRCTGTGSPTVIMEGGDDDTSGSYAYAETAVSEVTRTCVYDRANLGQSDPDPGPRGLKELVGDLEGLIEAAKIPGPYVLVGTSGGGYITAGYAVDHPEQTAGMLFVETPPPWPNPPEELIEVTRWDSPANIENRDYLQVERDAWAARREIGDIPITVISNEYTTAEIAAAEFPEERPLLRANVKNQRGWFALSPRAKQIVVHTGHSVEEGDPELVRTAILDVVRAARQTGDQSSGRIVFKRLDASTGGTVIYSVNPDGSQATQLFDQVAEGPSWSPDGTEIAIFCCDDGMSAHLLDPETGALRTLPMPDPGLETFCGGPWSPDGTRLTCESFGTEDPRRNGIYSISAADGGDLKRITSVPGGDDLPGDYSPDGKQLVFVRIAEEGGTPGLFAANVDGTGLRRLAPERLLVKDGWNGRWSPDGQQILFAARRSEANHNAIWVVDADGGTPPVQLPITPTCGGPTSDPDAFGCYSADWSPDGAQIVFVRGGAGVIVGDSTGESIYTVNADGTGLTQITDGEDDQPDWN